MDIARGGKRAPNGKVIPNKAQRRLLRKFVAEKRDQCKKAGITPIRYKLVDFRKWTSELNKLGPPMRSAPKWKDCWFHHKRQRNFFEFFYEKVRRNYQNKEKDVCEVKVPKKKNVSRKAQMRKFIELLKDKMMDSEARGESRCIITTEDFRKWTQILNKLGPVYPVDKWKMTWKTMKRQKHMSFEKDEFSKYKEIGCGSSEEFFLSDDDPTEDGETFERKSPREQRRSKRAIVTQKDFNTSYVNLCRICLQKKESLKSFVEGSYRNISYLDIYHECIGEAFKIYSFCSVDICASCEKNLLNMYIFRGVCLQTDTKLSFIDNRKDEMSGDETDDEESEVDLDAIEEKSIPENLEENLDHKDIFSGLEDNFCDVKQDSEDMKVFVPDSTTIYLTAEESREEKEAVNPLEPIICKTESDTPLQLDSDHSTSSSDQDSEESDYEEDLRKKTKRQGLKKRKPPSPIPPKSKDKKGRRVEKERPNRQQITLLRKLVEEKKETGEKFGVRQFRLKTNDFKRWAEKLNALGPPTRSHEKWKDCWFIHNKRKSGFYEFMSRTRRKGSADLEEARRSKMSQKKKSINFKQLQIFQTFIEDRTKECQEKGEKPYISTKDFRDLKQTLNLCGPPQRSVNEWKLAWRYKKRNSLKVLTSEMTEIGYDSSDAYCFTNESSDDDSSCLEQNQASTSRELEEESEEEDKSERSNSEE
ncbi:hypothetical protein DMENIID0001_095940 [Sergentomyia squamirostris]